MDELSRRAKIRALLFAKGYPLSLVDRKFGLKKNTASKTLQIPHQDGEAAIAAVLGVVNRFELWPDRYSPSGQRLSPLKYERPPTLAQRRNGRSQLAAVIVFGGLILSSLLTGDQARAHEFYDVQCCSDSDCAALAQGAVRATAQGYHVISNNTDVPFGDRRIKRSPDGQFHGCFYGGNPKHGLICLYVPEFGS